MWSLLRRLLERKGSSLNALRLAKAAVKHTSQLHDLMGWGGDSEAHRAGGALCRKAAKIRSP